MIVINYFLLAMFRASFAEETAANQEQLWRQVMTVELGESDERQ
jgi:hypothetical protein